MRNKTIILSIFLFLFIGCIGQKIRIGRTVNFLGPKTHIPVYWVDTDIKNYKYFEINMHTFIFENKIRPGIGGRLGIEKDINDFSVLFHSGISLIPNGGDIPGLAKSPIYGTLRTGARYNPWKIGIFIDHISSPFHGGKDGDDGKTLFLLEKEF